MVLVERELRVLSMRPSDSLDPSGSESTEDSLFSWALAVFVQQLHSCPSAWEVAAASRKKFTPYVLFALVIRQPFVDASNFGCRMLSMKLTGLLARLDVTEWQEFLQTALLNDGIYAAVFDILKRPHGGDMWLWGSRIVKEFKAVSLTFFSSHGLPEQLRLDEDMALLKVLMGNFNAISSRLAAIHGTGNGVVQYDDVNVLGEHAKALSGLTQGTQGSLSNGRLAVSKAGATKPSLRALIALNSITPDCLVKMRKAEFEKPPAAVSLLSAHVAVLRLIYNMASVPSDFSKLSEVPGGLAAVISSVQAAWSIASDSRSELERKNMAIEAVTVGLPALAAMACDSTLALEILSVTQDGCDAVALAKSVVAAAR